MHAQIGFVRLAKKEIQSIIESIIDNVRFGIHRMTLNYFDRRGFLKATAALVVMAMTTCVLAGAEAKTAGRPNILFCFADDWAWPHAGVYGDKVVKTPAFDRLAKEGVLFQHAFVSSPSCTPSRNAILTGQQFYRLERGANLKGPLDAKHPNFMFLLREAGYEVGHRSKAWGPGDFKKGGYTEHPCGPEVNFEEFMNSRDKGNPFCFWFGTNDPHRPYSKGKGAQSGIDLDKIHVPKFYPDEREIRSDIADYYYAVQRWDNDVANALKLLEQAGELDNTIVVMTGDNGIPFPRCKTNLYDWGVRAPLAIRWGSKIKPGRTVTDFVSLTDLAPTFLEAAGVEVPADMTGHSLIPVIKAEGEGRIDKSRDFMVFGRERHLADYPMRGLRTDKWLLILNLKPDLWPAGDPDKYIDCDRGPTKELILSGANNPATKKYYDMCFGKRGPVELYDCENDPEQVNNLANDPKYAETLEKLRTQLVNYLKTTKDPRFTDIVK